MQHNKKNNKIIALANRIQDNTVQVNEQFNKTLGKLDYITIFMKARYRNKWMSGYQKYAEDTYEEQIE